MQHMLVVVYWHFGTAYQSHFWGQLTLEDGFQGCSEMSVTYWHMLCNIQEEQKPHKWWSSTWPELLRLKWDTILTSIQVLISGSWTLRISDFLLHQDTRLELAGLIHSFHHFLIFRMLVYHVNLVWCVWKSWRRCRNGKEDTCKETTSSHRNK